MDQDQQVELHNDNKEHHHVVHQQLVHHQLHQQREFYAKNIYFLIYILVFNYTFLLFLSYVNKLFALYWCHKTSLKSTQSILYFILMLYVIHMQSLFLDFVSCYIWMINNNYRILIYFSFVFYTTCFFDIYRFDRNYFLFSLPPSLSLSLSF